LPAGADAVVAEEEVALERDDVVVRAPVLRGRHVRRRGEDLASGQEALPAGAALDPAAIALMAALGQATVRVTRRPRVAVLTTGDELRLPGEPLDGAAIYNANRFSLAAQLREAGADPLPLPVAADHPDAIAGALAAALDADAVVTSAGMCAGQRDHVAAALRDRGEFVSGEMRLRPARHVGIGRIDGKPVFALPGNPAASLIAFELLVRPAIRRLAGHTSWRRPEVAATLVRAVTSAPGVTQALWVRLEHSDHGWVALPAGPQGAGMLGTAARAAALLLVPEGVTAYPEGQSVVVSVLSGVVECN
jgi:molybdopterin molybdotransferase